MQMLQSLMGPAMQSSFDTYHQPGTQGLLQHLAGPALGMGVGMAAQHGVFGRGMMNQANGVGQAGMGNLMQMLPWLMML
jgi:hypothetical protein